MKKTWRSLFWFKKIFKKDYHWFNSIGVSIWIVWTDQQDKINTRWKVSASWVVAITPLEGFLRGNKLLREKLISFFFFFLFVSERTLYQRDHFLFGTADSCILISMITFWCSFFSSSVCMCTVISMCLLTACRYHLGLKSPPSCCWGSWLATIINLQQVVENSKWHANLSWCPSGGPPEEDEAMLRQTLSLLLSEI